MCRHRPRERQTNERKYLDPRCRCPVPISTTSREYRHDITHTHTRTYIRIRTQVRKYASIQVHVYTQVCTHLHTNNDPNNLFYLCFLSIQRFKYLFNINYCRKKDKRLNQRKRG